MGDDALNLLRLAVRPITARTLCQIRHMACLRLHHATDNALQSGDEEDLTTTLNMSMGDNTIGCCFP